jgi:hypothetical protein
MGMPNVSMDEEDTDDGNDNATTCETQRIGKLFGSVAFEGRTCWCFPFNACAAL